MSLHTLKFSIVYLQYVQFKELIVGIDFEIVFDLKTLQAGSTQYEVGASRAWKPAQQVEKRAERIPAIYRKKAKDADTLYNGLPADRTDAGPVERELAQYTRSSVWQLVPMEKSPSRSTG